MAAIKLTDEEQSLRNQIRDLLDTLWKDCKERSRRPHEDVIEDQERLGKFGCQLHQKLAARDFEPLHHRYMYKNRGVPTSDPTFYAHIHPSEDLLKYIENPAANADAPDLTIGVEFELSVYTNRWGHDDIYKLKRTRRGWDILAGPAISGKSKKSGYPILFKGLKHDSVSYPVDLKYHIESIWERACAGATHEKVQNEFDRISKWLRVCEQSAPDARDPLPAGRRSFVLSQGREGAITFMDVLGWKGIWNRDDRAMVKLEELRSLVVSWANGEALENTKRNCGSGKSIFRGQDTKVLLISDTLVISTFGDPVPTLWLHGELTAKAICESLERGIPLRGATCFGRFEVSERESVFLGPAVDEAAEWHEQLDWIGVVQTPTAMLSGIPLKTVGAPPWVSYQNPPVKGGKVPQLMACNWPLKWDAGKNGTRECLTEVLKKLGPIGPNIAPKIFASLDFYDKLSVEKRKQKGKR